jgi:serine carboxypeptidase 1
LQYLYNFLLDTSTDSTAAAPSAAAKPSATTGVQLTRYSEHLSTSGSNNTVEGILNGVVKERLKIIPKDLK